MNIQLDRKPALLLVDDQPTNLHALAAILKADYDLSFATSGEAALQLAENELPDLVLLDVILPGISGIEVLRVLRANQKTANIPVILVTAASSEQNEINGLDLGADDYLTKPVQAQILLARVRNILLKKRAEMQSRLALHVFEHSGEALLICGRDHRLLQVNPAFTRLTGYSQDEVRGKAPTFLAIQGERDEDLLEMWQQLQQSNMWRNEIWNRRKDGSAFPALLSISKMQDARGEVDFYIASLVDISEQKATEEEIRRIAHHDALTGLPNRLHLNIHLTQVLPLARRHNHSVALMFIDLDRFKVINDTLGHDIGDELLVEVAKRLRACVRESDLVARLGGDEFVVVLPEVHGKAAIQVITDKILHCLSSVYHLDEHQVHSSPSIGISLYPQDGQDAETVLKNADCAMYHAKALGRNNAQYFDAVDLQAR
ncbi:MAG: diguanylate cyclase [Burkholderiales bacterium]|nr:diguanylate cyclase [Burkholderiales bacterium]